MSSLNKTAHNSSLAKWRLPCIYDSVVLNQYTVIRLNFYAEMLPLRQAANHYGQYIKTSIQKLKLTKNLTQTHIKMSGIDFWN